MSDVPPVSGISGPSFDSPFPTPLSFCLFALTCHFSAKWSILMPFFVCFCCCWENSPILFVKIHAFLVWLMFSSQEMIFNMCRCVALAFAIMHLYIFGCFCFCPFLFYVTWEQFWSEYFIDRVWLFTGDPLWLTGHKIQLLTCDATNSLNCSFFWRVGGSLPIKYRFLSRSNEPVDIQSLVASLDHIIQCVQWGSLQTLTHHGIHTVWHTFSMACTQHAQTHVPWHAYSMHIHTHLSLHTAYTHSIACAYSMACTHHGMYIHHDMHTACAHTMTEVLSHKLTSQVYNLLVTGQLHRHTRLPLLALLHKASFKV